MCVGKGQRSPQSNGREAEEAPSDGERMTAELRDIACQFVQKVSVNMTQKNNLHTYGSMHRFFSF